MYGVKDVAIIRDCSTKNLSFSGTNSTPSMQCVVKEFIASARRRQLSTKS